MFKFTKADREEVSALSDDLSDAHALLLAKQAEMGAQIAHLIESLNESREAYRGKVDDAARALQDKINDHRDAYEDKSERWQEGDRGEAVREWIEKIEEMATEMENVTIDDVEMPEIDEPEDFSERINDIDSEPV